MSGFLKTFLLFGLILIISTNSFSQKDSTKRKTADSSISYSRKIFNKLYKNITQDTNKNNNSVRPERNDIRFQKFKGRVIRNIIPEQMDFGIPINDTGKNVRNFLTSLANHLHKNTTPNNIRKNLFFSKMTNWNPFLSRIMKDI